MVTDVERDYLWSTYATDPRARIKMRELIKGLGEKGKTIMVSSHILPELADICNKIGIIERGELFVNADVADVMRQVRRQPVLRIEVVGDRDAAAKLLESHDLVQSVQIYTCRCAIYLDPNIISPFM